MRFIPRELENQLLQAARSFPAVVLTGPRRAGKTALLRRAVPGASYFLLEAPDVVALFLLWTERKAFAGLVNRKNNVA